ncbi:MAG: carbohydrate-binding domain-containing protein [Thermotogota bacterium]|nr:carbohydrate-binding domain-containing protein [Thermotogota bacterium]
MRALLAPERAGRAPQESRGVQNRAVRALREREREGEAPSRERSELSTLLLSCFSLSPEGLCSEMHLTIEGGAIIINSQDDGIDADMDITINGGTVVALGSRNDVTSRETSARSGAHLRNS